MLKAELAGFLKHSILSGRLLPGERVVEGTWAREAGVAQASVREAINLLITEGFLVKDAGRSARVPRYTQSDIDRIYQVRGALEALATRLAAEVRADLTAAEEALDRCPLRRTPARSGRLSTATSRFIWHWPGHRETLC